MRTRTPPRKPCMTRRTAFLHRFLHRLLHRRPGSRGQHCTVLRARRCLAWQAREYRRALPARRHMESVSFVVPVQGSKPYTALVKGEVEGWTVVSKAAGIKPE